jgi:hypothetical protein
MVDVESRTFFRSQTVLAASFQIGVSSTRMTNARRTAVGPGARRQCRVIDSREFITFPNSKDPCVIRLEYYGGDGVGELSEDLHTMMEHGATVCAWFEENAERGASL